MGGAVTLGNIFGAPIEEVRFARDSPLEGDGFEPSVPGKIIISYRFETVFRRFRNAPYSPKAPHPFAAGTWSSNLLCSSGESRANRTSSIGAPKILPSATASPLRADIAQETDTVKSRKIK